MMDASLVTLLHTWTESHRPVTASVVLVAQYGIFVLPVALVVVWINSDSRSTARQAWSLGASRR